MDSTEAYRFDLPPELVAAHPAQERDGSRLLVVRRSLPPSDPPLDAAFLDLADLLNPGDLLVRNETRVIPARILGKLRPGGGRVEMLLIEPGSPSDASADPGSVSEPPTTQWWALCKPARKLSPGTLVDLPDGQTARVLAAGEAGLRLLALPPDLDQFLDQHGHIPLPPYILQRRATEDGPDLATDLPEDRVRYQTVYARESGSVAAPTAGLHFTDRVIQRLGDRGIAMAGLVLHVGIGTFRPMESGRVSDHRMHSERGHLPLETVEAIARTRERGGRVIAIGTTTCRTLEGVAAQNSGQLAPGNFSTDIFIRPGHHFQVIDGLVTNFHLPESTLMVLVAALAGHTRIMEAYRHAVHQRYRFFSYGDSMLIL